MKPGTKITLGIMTSLVTAGFIFVYDSYIKERIDSEEVVVIKAGQEILKSEKITKDKLVIERRPKEALIDGVVLASDINEVVGKDAGQDIVGNSMISKQMVDFDLLVPNRKKGEAIRPITKDMIFAKPGSLRRKDVVDIYLIYNDGSFNYTENGPSEVQSASTTTEENPEDQTLTEDITNQSIKPFLTDVKVVYVKDSGNKEVVSSAEDKKEDKRLNATSTISDLEVILSEDDFAKLMDEVLSKHAKLYITYQ